MAGYRIQKTVSRYLLRFLLQRRGNLKNSYLRDDLYDGQVLQKLFESLKKTKNLLGLSDIRQQEAGQKRKLEAILNAVNEELEYDRLGQ